MINARIICLQALLLGTTLIAISPSFALDAASAPSNAPAVKASAGAIVGRLTNAQNMPIAGATVTAVRADGGAIRATISGSDGVYSFADLAPGVWSLTVQADGVPDVSAGALQVTASQATRRDLVRAEQRLLLRFPCRCPHRRPALRPRRPLRLRP